MTTSQAFGRRQLLVLGGGALAAAATTGLAACTNSSPPLPPSANGTSKGGAASLESPMLTERVKAGKLPKLAKRLPSNPMVQDLWKGPGQYGGTLHVAEDDALQAQVVTSYATYGLLEWNLKGTDGIPSLAASVEANSDNSEYTITLRDGLRWSDGEPLTTDDLLFAFKDVHLNKTLNPTPPVWFRNADLSDPKVAVKSDTVIVVTFNGPFSLFKKYLWMPFQSHQPIKPKHYLKAFHPSYTSKAKLAAAAKKAGFDTWDQLFAAKDDPWLNPDRPTAAPFMMMTAATGNTLTASYERNPYYFKTDPHGRQLPYIDKLQAQILSDDTINLRAANGELDLISLELAFTSTGLLQKNAKSKGFRTMRWQARSSNINLFLNLSHKDKITRNLFANIDFRAALSQAINRDDLNNQLLGGIGSYRQFTPQAPDAYAIPGIGQRFLKYDVDASNKLLDGLGLTSRNRSGTRLDSTGKPLEFVVIFVEDTSIVKLSDALNFVSNAWKQIGVKLTLKPVDNTLYYNILPSNDYDIIQYTGHSVDWDMEPIWFVPQNNSFRTGPAYGDWCSTNGKTGMEPTDDIKNLWSLWTKLVEAPTDAERVAAGKQIAKQWDEQVYVIGVIGVPFRPAIANVKLQNVRDDDQVPLVYFHGFEGVTRPEQQWFAS